MIFMAYDLETGGLTRDRSPLTAYFVVFDEEFQILGELDLKIKPNGDDPYIVDAGALAVNKINLIEHSKEAVALDVAKKLLFDFLFKMSEEGYKRLTPVGQNVAFDEAFVLEWLISANNWKRFVSYHSLDTAGIATFLKFCGIIPFEQKTRLSALAEFFNIKTGTLHTAKEDAITCVKILKKAAKTVRGDK